MGTHGPARGQAALDQTVPRRRIPPPHPQPDAQPSLEMEVSQAGGVVLTLSVLPCHFLFPACLPPSLPPCPFLSLFHLSLLDCSGAFAAAAAKQGTINQTKPSVLRRIHRSTWANPNKGSETMLGGERPRGKSAAGRGDRHGAYGGHGGRKLSGEIRGSLGSGRAAVLQLPLHTAGQPLWLPPGLQAASEDPTRGKAGR